MRRHSLRLGLALWIGGMVGVVALIDATWPMLQVLTPYPTPVAVAVALLQSGFLVAAAVWAGVVPGRRIGLGAPAIAALIDNEPSMPTWRAQLGPATAVGGFSALFIVLAQCVAPAPLLQGNSGGRLPLVVRMLYGGLTEEILLRWGLMALLAWAAWRILQRGQGSPKGIWFFLAATISAVIFGMAHVPAAVGMGAEATPPVVLYVTGVNFVPGLLMGLLFWRRGLEAACMAHMLAHVGMEIGFAFRAGALSCSMGPALSP